MLFIDRAEWVGFQKTGNNCGKRMPIVASPENLVVNKGAASRVCIRLKRFTPKAPSCAFRVKGRARVIKQGVACDQKT
jgi:hypothetical protein